MTDQTIATDTAPESVAADDPLAGSWPHRKLSIWHYIGLGLLLLIGIAVVVASVVRLPYYRLSPGSVYDTIDRVEAPAEQVRIPDGKIGFVTVSQTSEISAWQWLGAKLDDASVIRHEDEINGDRTSDEKREQDQRRMQLSKNDAVVVALERLGYELTVEATGVEVARVFACGAADGVLNTGDVIVGLDGNEVREMSQLLDGLAVHSIGDEIELLVERIDPSNSALTLRTELVGLALGSADADCLIDEVQAEEPRPFIGIGTAQMSIESLPFDVDIDTGRVGGPSAGLAFTLAVIDVLSEGDLTNGAEVVATGTINRDGVVGPVGGVHQKTIAAERSGADLFLVPLCCENFVDRTTGEPIEQASNFEEAMKHAGDMRVVGVATLDDALAAIGEIGGDVDMFITAVS